MKSSIMPRVSSDTLGVRCCVVSLKNERQRCSILSCHMLCFNITRRVSALAQGIATSLTHWTANLDDESFVANCHLLSSLEETGERYGIRFNIATSPQARESSNSSEHSTAIQFLRRTQWNCVISRRIRLVSC